MLEEKPEPRNGHFGVACILVGSFAGSFGAVLALACADANPNYSDLTRLVGGSLIGVGVGLTIWMFWPRGEIWESCVSYALLLTVDFLGSTILSFLVLYIVLGGRAIWDGRLIP